LLKCTVAETIRRRCLSISWRKLHCRKTDSFICDECSERPRYHLHSFVPGSGRPESVTLAYV